MQHTMKRLLINLLISLCIGSAYAQETAESIGFTHIGLNEGLSQSTVFDIEQDPQGRMWFATYDGLNCYDGYDFRVYHHQLGDSTSLAGDIARCLLKDGQERLWIGTSRGLSLYDAALERFHNYPLHQNERQQTLITDIESIGDSLLLLCTSSGLQMFNIPQRKFDNARLPEILRKLTPTTLCHYENTYYIGTEQQGLYAYNPSNHQVWNIPVKGLRHTAINTLLQQSPSILWIGTEGQGLYRLNPHTGTARNWRQGDGSGLGSNYVRALTLDADKQLWVGTFTSLNLYDAGNERFLTYGNPQTTDNGLSQVSVRSIFMDAQNGMWVGTYFGGLNYYHPMKNRFRNIQHIPGKNSLNNNVVGCIVKDRQGNLWIGTGNGGVNRYNEQNNTFTYYTTRNGLGSNDVKAIYVDEDKKQVYIGTHTGGLNILYPASGRIERRLKNVEHVYAILPASNGDLWLSDLHHILRYNPAQDKAVAIEKLTNGSPIPLTYITYIYRDSQNRLWFGGQNGLCIYNETPDHLLEATDLNNAIAPIAHRFVNSIHESGKGGVFWIGTRNGLFRLDESTRQLKQYTTADGLPNNVVQGIMEDEMSRLWLSTDKGLSCFDPQTGRFRNYIDSDGLQSNQFNASAYFNTTDGQMYFGGINGITSFYPDRMTNSPFAPPVIITGLRLFNKTVHPGDATGILSQSISQTPSITLKASQSMFSLEFVVPNYISGIHNTYAYTLEGYDPEWYQTTNLRTASYSNLPHGTYRFLVKAANSDGKWNHTPTALTITVLPVWYRTWWATLLFVIAFIAICIFIFRYFWIRKSMEAKLQMERIDKERQKEVSEMKLRFFINISHELRTPLTLILAPLQDLLNKVDDRWIRKQLELMHRNTNRLLHLVNQLMDYRRAELGVFKLHVKPNNVHQLIRKDYQYYERIAQRKNISYNFYSEVEGKEILCDPDYLELIVNNLLSNAFKYTGEGKSITVTLKEEGNQLLLQVKDTGRGIPIDKQGKIFERFYQVDSEHPGSGIGLSLVQRLVELHHGHIELDSQEGTGSTFSIYLPTAPDAYNEEETASPTEDQQAMMHEAHSTNRQEMYMVDTLPEDEETTGSTDSTETPTDSPKEKRQEHILIVEDHADIRTYLRDELAMHYRVSEAGNGQEALDILQEQEVDLVLTDVMMPVMDGIKLCKHIKQNLRTSHIPVIILSAKGELNEQLEGLQVGADDYIPKPFSLIMVMTKIRNLFRTRHQAIQHYSHSLEVEPEKLAMNPLDEELLKRAIAIVEKHLDDTNFSTEEFAREMFMSRSNLHLKIKALTGEATNDFIRKFRLNRACKLLREGRHTVSEISSMVGFSSPSYFATNFKKFFGCMPSEYAKKKGNDKNFDKN